MTQRCPKCGGRAGALKKRLRGEDGKYREAPFIRRDGSQLYACPRGECPQEDFIVAGDPDAPLPVPVARTAAKALGPVYDALGEFLHDPVRGRASLRLVASVDVDAVARGALE